MKRPGNILLTFILITTLALVAFSLFFVVGGRLRSSTDQSISLKSFYVAEAGVNKALWYLTAPSGDGGHGISFRTGGMTENFGDGEYTIMILDSATPSEVVITSTGEVKGVKRTIEQRITMGGFPAAFDYAIFSNSDLSASGSVMISGDIYVNGNTRFSGSCSVVSGEVYHPQGKTVSGSGSVKYTDGGAPDPLPPQPVLDTSFYTGQIGLASTVLAKDKSYTGSINLNGATVYVHGNVNISGSGTITGPGAIVATGNINISGSEASNGSDIKFISGGTLSISGSSSMPNSSFYSSGDMSVSGSGRFIVGSFISDGDLSMSGSCTLQGLGYAAGTAKFSGSINIMGSLVASSISGLSGSVRVTYDKPSLPDALPPGLTGDKVKLKKGGWSEKKNK